MCRSLPSDPWQSSLFPGSSRVYSLGLILFIAARFHSNLLEQFCLQVPRGVRLKIAPKVTLGMTEMHTGFLNHFGCNKMQFQGNQRNLLTLVLFGTTNTIMMNCPDCRWCNDSNFNRIMIYLLYLYFYPALGCLQPLPGCGDECEML